MVKKERMVEKEDQEKGKLKQTKTNVPIDSIPSGCISIRVLAKE